MKINRIKMENIKGQDTVQELTGKDIIVGRNGAGKTTRMQAIGLAALGYVPGKGKTLADTFELSSSNRMLVGLEADTFEFSRGFEKSSKIERNGNETVKITQDITISPSAGERTLKQKDERIRDEIGDFPAMLDFGAFIALTDTGKRDFIYNLSGNRFSWDKARVEEHLKAEVLRDELRDANPDMYEVMTANYEETMRQYKEGADVQDGLLAMTEHAKEKLSYWKKEKNNAEAAAQKLSEIKNRADETDRDLAINQEQLQELRKESERLAKAIAVAEEQEKSYKDMEKQLDKLREEITAMSQDEGLDAFKEIEANLKECEEHKERLAQEEKKCNEELEKKEAEIEEYDRRLQSSREAKQKAVISKNQIEATIKAESELVDAIVNAKGTCAFSKEIPCTQDFSGFLEERHDKIDSLYEELDDAMEMADSETRKLAALEEELQKAKEAKKEVEAELRDIRVDLYTNIPNTIENLKQKQAAVINREPEIEKKQAEAAKIEAQLLKREETNNDSLKEEKDDVQAKISEMEEKIEKQKKIRNDIANIKANIIDSKTATYQQECWNQIALALGQKGIQGEIVKEMLEPIRSDIDKKLEEIGINKSFFFETESETGKEIFNFGWIDRGTKRLFAALSQGEQLLLMIALMTTIIERSNPPLKILAIDEINNLDKENLQKVIKGLDIAGRNMDNIILAGVADLTAIDLEGWKVWEL